MKTEPEVDISDMVPTTLTHSQLLEEIRYEPETGRWFWLKARSSNKCKVGDEAGCIRKHTRGKPPRRYIVVFRKQFLASRLAWFYMTGEWPKYTIDHIDRNTLNDRWDNLRDVTYQVNNQNRVFK